MNELIWQLQMAHAIETGAYEAYEGHAAAMKDPAVKQRIKEIQKEEWYHRQALGFMLIELEAESNKILDRILYIIGRLISMGCYFMGFRMAAWGAKIMEIMGADVYKKLAKEARNAGYPAMGVELDRMQLAEEAHEAFFKECLNPSCQCRYLGYLNGTVAREVNRKCGAKHD